jgi:hypothetical protein
MAIQGEKPSLAKYTKAFYNNILIRYLLSLPIRVEKSTFVLTEKRPVGSLIEIRNSY